MLPRDNPVYHAQYRTVKFLPPDFPLIQSQPEKAGGGGSIVRSRLRPPLKWSALADDFRTFLVSTTMNCVDQQVEMGEETLAQYSSNAGIGGLNLAQVLDDGVGLFHRVHVVFEGVENRDRALRVTRTDTSAAEPWSFSRSLLANAESITVRSHAQQISCSLVTTAHREEAPAKKKLTVSQADEADV